MKTIIIIVLLLCTNIVEAQNNPTISSNFKPTTTTFYQYGTFNHIIKDYYFNGRISTQYKLKQFNLDTFSKTDFYYDDFGNIISKVESKYGNGITISSISKSDYVYLNNNLLSEYDYDFNLTTKIWKPTFKRINLYNSRDVFIGYKLYEYNAKWRYYRGDSTQYNYLNYTDLKYVTKVKYETFTNYSPMYFSSRDERTYDSTGFVSTVRTYNFSRHIVNDFYKFNRNKNNEITDVFVKEYDNNDILDFLYNNIKFIHPINNQKDFESLGFNKTEILSAEVFRKQSGVYVKSAKYDSVYKDNYGSYIRNTSYFNNDSNKYILAEKVILLYSSVGNLLEKSRMIYSPATSTWRYIEGNKYEYIYDSNNNLIEYIIYGGPNLDVEDFRYVYSDFIFSSINNESLPNKSVKIYPNPTSNGIFNIELNTEVEKINKIIISDVSGKTIQTLEITLPFENTINLSQLPSGTYLLKLITYNQVHFSRIVIN